ncbi:hypothetical protein QTO34_018789 [Cnephaeus nilssonii]|uniref:Uncharacterized protein n=1 Tax=Cnephaeus nilssonii TaxID=3371016 RepID=A0AA40HZF8_CNENI|nr:hypothetical protein QTO34_018789 [Eptesicus nilssonii]
MGTSQAAAREKDKPPTLGSRAPATGPAPVARERDNPHAPRSRVPAAVPVARERDKPPAPQSQAKPPTHGRLRLQSARIKPDKVLGACGRPEGGQPGSQVPAIGQRKEFWVLGSTPKEKLIGNEEFYGHSLESLHLKKEKGSQFGCQSVTCVTTMDPEKLLVPSFKRLRVSPMTAKRKN